MARDSDARSARLAARWWLGVVLAVVGAALLWIGWYRVSGETLVAAQLPYIASASIPGAALVVAGAVLLGGGFQRGADSQTEGMIDALYGLLTETNPTDPALGDAARQGEGGGVALPEGTQYHRPGCLLVEGKPDARLVSVEEVRRRGLLACHVCSPGPVE